MAKKETVSKTWVGRLGSFVKHVYIEWREDGTHRLGAGVAFYGLIALIPYLAIMIVIAVTIFSPQEIVNSVVDFGEQIFKPETFNSEEVRQTYSERVADSSGVSTVAGALGLGSFIVTASLFILAVQDALKVIWKLGRRTSFSLSRYLFGFIVMISGAATFTLGLGVRTVATALQETFDSDEFFVSGFFDVLTTAGFVVLLTLFFMLLTRILVHVKLDARSLAISSLITAVFMVLGEYGLEVYFAYFADYSYSGALGAYFIVLFAIYYFAQIFLIGAQTGKVLSYRRGNEYLAKRLKKTDPRFKED